MRPLLTALPLAVVGCWSSSRPIIEAPPPPEQPVSSATVAPQDATLERDVNRIGAYLVGTGEPFTAVELVGFTATHGIVYRTTVCDLDELGARGPYCTADVCVDPPVSEATCESLVSETVGEPRAAFDLDRVRAEIETAEAAMKPTTRGHTEALSVVTIATKRGDLSLTAPTWFGPTSWTLLQAPADPDRENVRYGFSSVAITSVLSSDDGTCLAVAGTAFQQARYESVVGLVRVAFAARRCRGATIRQ